MEPETTDNSEYEEYTKRIDSKSPVDRLLAISDIHRLFLKKTEDEPVNELDIKLFKGLYKEKEDDAQQKILMAREKLDIEDRFMLGFRNKEELLLSL